ncbi:hypothetical protein CTI14_07990, partial [Methylobacterium radiotolerans]
MRRRDRGLDAKPLRRPAESGTAAPFLAAQDRDGERAGEVGPLLDRPDGVEDTANRARAETLTGIHANLALDGVPGLGRATEA